MISLALSVRASEDLVSVLIRHAAIWAAAEMPAGQPSRQADSPERKVVRKDVPVVFHVASTEALKRVICRFIDLPAEEREGFC
jgi:hypothetical protein